MPSKSLSEKLDDLHDFDAGGAQKSVALVKLHAASGAERLATFRTDIRRTQQSDETSPTGRTRGPTVGKGICESAFHGGLYHCFPQMPVEGKREERRGKGEERRRREEKGEKKRKGEERRMREEKEEEGEERRGNEEKGKRKRRERRVKERKVKEEEKGRIFFNFKILPKATDRAVKHNGSLNR